MILPQPGDPHQHQDEPEPEPEPLYPGHLDFYEQHVELVFGCLNV